MNTTQSHNHRNSQSKNNNQTSPKELAKKFFNRSQNSIKRVGKTAVVSAAMGLKIAQGQKFTPVMLRKSFEEMGTTYIKIGQFIASMPSVFPKEYVEAFQGCLDQTTPLPFSYIEGVLREELLGNGKTLSDYFSYIEKTPMASASIAQVHAATLLDGTSVVLKVQKPEVDTIIETDLGMLHGASKLIDLVFPEVKVASISSILDEIRTQMNAETDFVNEAQNIADFHDFLTTTNNDRVTAPVVINELTSKRVLTMTRLDGVSMIDTEAMQEYCSDPSDIIAMTINTWFSSVMQAKNFHADLHAGNLMLLKDGRVGFIDFGIVGHVKPESWAACNSMMVAVQTQNYQMMAESMIDVGMTADRQKVNVLKLAEDIEATITMLNDNPLMTEGIRTVNASGMKHPVEEMNELMLELMEVAKRHGIQFPRDFVLLIKQMLYFDRFLQVLAPDMSMFDDQHIHMMGELEG